MISKKSGFVSMALVYTFLIIFLFLMLAILKAHIEKDKYLEAISNQIDEDINKDKQNRSFILNKILEDNSPQSYELLKFVLPANDSVGNGNGLFYIDKKELTDENNDGESNKIYFFRGSVDNNHLIFANLCFRILRTNEDGSIRIVYDGQQTNNTCKDINDKPNVGIAADIFREEEDVSLVNSDDNGQIPSYDDNNIHSNVFDIINRWYLDFIINGNYSDKVSKDTIFCNNKTVLPISQLDIYYQAKSMVPTLINPNNNNYHDLTNVKNSFTLTCENVNDRYSAIDRTLKYPVGLVTAEELLLAGSYLTDSSDTFQGGESGKINKKFYLHNNQSYWTISPFNKTQSGSANMVIYNENGYMQPKSVTNVAAYVIPVLSLKSDTVIISGDGTAMSPYIIEGGNR